MAPGKTRLEASKDPPLRLSGLEGSHPLALFQEAREKGAYVLVFFWEGFCPKGNWMTGNMFAYFEGHSYFVAFRDLLKVSKDPPLRGPLRLSGLEGFHPLALFQEARGKGA